MNFGHATTSQRAGRHARAFTLVELCMGMVVTSMVMGALAAFSMAMSTAWQSAEKSQAMSLMGNQAILRVQNEIRKAKLLGACRVGSADGSAAGAAIMIWLDDTNGDGLVQGNEVEMIIHDTATHTLKLYYSGQADALTSWSYAGQFTSSTIFSQFATNRQCYAIASGVYGAMFQTSGTAGTTQSPTLEIALKLMVNDTRGAAGKTLGGTGKLAVQYGSATIRAPKAQPAS